jgi:hypothetical protein
MIIRGWRKLDTIQRLKVGDTFLKISIHGQNQFVNLCEVTELDSTGLNRPIITAKFVGDALEAFSIWDHELANHVTIFVDKAITLRPIRAFK